MKKNFLNKKWLYNNKSFKPNQNNKLNRKIVYDRKSNNYKKIMPD